MIDESWEYHEGHTYKKTLSKIVSHTITPYTSKYRNNLFLITVLTAEGELWTKTVEGDKIHQLCGEGGEPGGGWLGHYDSDNYEGWRPVSMVAYQHEV